MRSSSWSLAAATGLVLVGLALATPAFAQEKVSLDVTVVHVSDGEGGVASDARAKKADKILKGQVPYSSLSVLDAKQRRVPVNDVWQVKLPNGKKFAVRPLGVNDQGVLVAVDLEKSAQGDFRVRKNKPVVIGGESYRGGKLVVILEADR